MNEITQTRDTTTKASREQMAQALKLLNSLPRRSVDGKQGDLNAEAYFLAMAGATRYGLNLATQAALRGEHGSAFFPSPPEFRKLYESAMQPVYAQRDAEKRAMEREADEAHRKTIKRPTRTADEIARDLNAFPGMDEDILRDTPIGRRMARMRMENAGKRVLATGISLDRFRHGAATHEWGVGARYAPMLQTVFAE